MFAPAARMDSRPRANALPSQGSANGGSSVSGRTWPNPCLPPMSWIPSTGRSLPSGVHADQGARPQAQAGTDGTLGYQRSHGPGVELEGPCAPRGERRVEHVQRVESLDAVDEVFLAEPVQGAHGEPACVDLRALLEQRLDLPVHRQVAGESLGRDGGVAAMPGREQDSRAVQDDRHVESLANQAGRGEQVDQGYRAFERDRVNEYEGLLTGIGPDVVEDLFLGVVQRVDSGLAARRLDGDRHGSSWQLMSTDRWGGAASRRIAPARAAPGRQGRRCAARTPQPRAAAAGEARGTSRRPSPARRP